MLTLSFHWIWGLDFCVCVCVCAPVHTCVCVCGSLGDDHQGFLVSHFQRDMFFYPSSLCQKVSLKTCFWKLLQFVFRHKSGLAGWRDRLVWTEVNKHEFTLCSLSPTVIKFLLKQLETHCLKRTCHDLNSELVLLYFNILIMYFLGGDVIHQKGTEAKRSLQPRLGSFQACGLRSPTFCSPNFNAPAVRITISVCSSSFRQR